MPTAMPPEPLTSRLGNLPGKNPRLLVLLVVVRLKIDRVELDVLEHLGRDRAELGLGVPHRRGGQAVNAAEVPLAGDQQVPHVPPLGHPRQGGINRVITVRVITLHRLADDTGALAGGLRRGSARGRASPPGSAAETA